MKSNEVEIALKCNELTINTINKDVALKQFNKWINKLPSTTTIIVKGCGILIKTVKF